MSLASLPTIAQAGRDIAAGKLSPVELTDLMLSRIEAHNSTLNAYITVTADLARKQASQAEADIKAGRYRGPLHGIPIGIKDIFQTANVPTTGHSRSLIDRVPTADATSVAKMTAAGAICLGKLATHEFAFGGPSFDLPWPPARNPWNTDHFTGGSSSGTGAAVTGGLALGGFGSDTGGSIRLPAAFSGLVGIKPTYGRVSRSGVYPLSFSLDHAGPLAWTAEDCALMLGVMAGYDGADPASADVAVPDYRKLLDRDLTGIRIGVVRHFWEEADATSETVQAMETALAVLKDLGARLVDIKLPSLQDYTATTALILLVEAAAVYQDTLQKSPELLGEILRKRLYLASMFSGADYVQALRRRRELCDAYNAATQDVDVVFTATAPGPAARLDAMHWFYTFTTPLLTMPFNLTGSPAVATRAGFSSSGLPLSFQLAGKPFDEATVLAVAHAYEKATDWVNMRPAIAKL
ncbi:amidase [Bordetella sp. N]|uniref:amidase n=1 Tax=Bordetella sp. N TaxID=1746199 RepID=UPI00070F70D5|nr:amidase [Bordetella sp. N]ALM86461.1 hypothetical protein ASB57_29160 [Bordetella sp. N]